MSSRSIVDTAVELTGSGIPVLPIRSGLKKPIVSGNGHWEGMMIKTPDEAATVLSRSRGCNLAALTGAKWQSHILIVGLDSYRDHDGRSATWLRDLGMKSSDPAWLWRTGRGGYATAFFLPPELASKGLVRQAPAPGYEIDLLVNGYCLLPPSNTSKEKDGGGPYAWVSGHSPWDIRMADVMAPPSALVEWWLELSRKAKPAASDKRTLAAASDTRGLFTTPIPEHRNTTLTKIAGKLALKYRGAELESLLLGQNLQLCRPPLPQEEVLAIARSIDSRQTRKSHTFRGVTPAPLS